MQPAVTREVTVDAPVEEVWTAITDDEARSAWLGDDGADRVVEVEHAVEGEHITWTWWAPEEGPGTASTVTITLLPHGDGTTGVRVVERASANLVARAQLSTASSWPGTWGRRLLGLEVWLLLAVERV